jgi:hypothetical protein
MLSFSSIGEDNLNVLENPWVADMFGQPCAVCGMVITELDNAASVAEEWI